jgi:rare lipoprotein A (peptidoglycan hydrolase)
MHEGDIRREAGFGTTGRRAQRRFSGRPDRVALWAGCVAIVAALAAAASAHATSGGTALPGAPTPCQQADLGDRTLRLGDCGTDVKTLNWVLKSRRFGSAVETGKTFDSPTEDAVKALQEKSKLPSDGIVNPGTALALKSQMHSNTASWYGPGFWGSRTACGHKLKKDTLGVAHKHLPCGTKVTFFAHGNWLRTKVIDRGPYVKHRKWDLTQAAAEQLDVEVTEKVRAAPVN